MNSESKKNKPPILIDYHSRKDYPLLGGYASRMMDVYPSNDSKDLFMLFCTTHFLKNVELVTIIGIIGGKSIEENPSLQPLIQQTIIELLQTEKTIKRIRYVYGSRPFFVKVFETLVKEFPGVVCTTITDLNGHQFWQLVETSDEQNPPAQPK